MPVVDREQLVGIVTMSDLLHALNADMSNVLGVLQQSKRNEHRQRR
jgi:CBS domain-containing protein